MNNRATELNRLEARFDELWPLTRSITGPGLRDSLRTLSQDIPLEVEGVKSGTEVFDWTIPDEWHIKEARLTGPDGEMYADLEETNLAVVNYSTPVDRHLSLEELDSHLYTLPEQPEATPYVTSYYERNWGFCLPHSVYENLPEGEYHVYIDSEFVDGELNYAHTTLPGESDREILLSSYLCHPSLANNELSGPLVLTSLYNRLSTWDSRKFTYRFVVAPETIGSLAYLSRMGRHLRENLSGGFVLTCLGGPRSSLSYKRSRREDAFVDQTVSHFHQYSDREIDLREFDPRSGSDERQYCSPGFNLPVGQFARTVYAQYDEYHTSLDTKEFMGFEPLIESAETIGSVLETLENGGFYMRTNPFGEPMLSKHELYRTVNDPSNTDESVEDTSNGNPDVQPDFTGNLMTILNYADGDHSVLEIADQLDTFAPDLSLCIERLLDAGLIRESPHEPSYNSEFELPETANNA